jgi:hypothetical protein
MPKPILARAQGAPASNYPRLHCKHSQPHPPANPREKAKIERGGILGSYTLSYTILLEDFNDLDSCTSLGGINIRMLGFIYSHFDYKP